MRRFVEGDQVRIDIPDQSDPDHQRYHGETGEIAEIIHDDAGHHSGDGRDSYLFYVALDDGRTEHFRWRDLRPVSSKST